MQTAEIVEFPMVRDSKYLGVSIDFQETITYQNRH